VKKGWKSQWFYLCNDDVRLSAFTHCVVLEENKRWRWGLPRELQTHMKPLLDVLRRCWDRGLTVAGVIAVFHRRRVLPLTDHRLCLDEMTPKASLESSQMASTALATDKLL
jgi:hypothetical protein